MSSPPFAPGATPRPRPRPAAAARPPVPKKMPWTWLERFLILQGFIPALLFIPGISSARVLIRMASYLMAMAVWFAVIQSGRSRPSGPFAAGLWLKLMSGWLGLLVFHWNSISMPAALGQATLYIAVFSPVFWAPKAMASPRQLGRVMAILLVCNTVSTLVGLGQVFRPGTFNPPVIPGITNVAEDQVAASLIYTDAAGRKIIRPCGLSDTPGAAAASGAVSVLIGLAFSLRRIGKLRRLACLASSFCGMAVIYYSQVRMVFVMEIICLGVLVGIFVLQRNFTHAAALGGLSAAMVVGAFLWVMSTSGLVVVERFLGLAQTSIIKSYTGAGRAEFVQHTLTVGMWEDPLGQGLGRWGAIKGALGDPADRGVFIEVMIQGWVVDGGIPLLVLYTVAIVAAMAAIFGIALRSRDRDVGFWAAVVFASNLSVIATCFSYVTFITAIGTQFWFLAAVIHAADDQTRREAAARPRRAPARPAPPGPSPAPGPTAPA